MRHGADPLPARHGGHAAAHAHRPPPARALHQVRVRAVCVCGGVGDALYVGSKAGVRIALLRMLRWSDGSAGTRAGASNPLPSLGLRCPPDTHYPPHPYPPAKPPPPPPPTLTPHTHTHMRAPPSPMRPAAAAGRWGGTAAGSTSVPRRGSALSWTAWCRASAPAHWTTTAACRWVMVCGCVQRDQGVGEVLVRQASRWMGGWGFRAHHNRRV